MYEVIEKAVLAYSEELRQLSVRIHTNPELAYKEYQAHELLTDYLEKKQFVVSRSAFGLETAFLAEYGPLSPCAEDELITIGFLSEFDALPQIGHACGHNLIAIVGIGSAIAFKEAIQQHNIQNCKIKLFGTPAEEKHGGKIDMTKKNAFKNVDIALMAHPGNINCIYASFLAMQQLNVEYFGKAAHASAAPFEGINALDALVLAYQSISNLRQQMHPTNRVHGIITKGGDAPNIIPEHTTAEYFIRTTRASELQKLKTKVIACFHASAQATGCTVKIVEQPMFYDVRYNEILCELYIKHMNRLGEQFPPRSTQESISRGSTDMGNVTYECPGIHPLFDIGVSANLHTLEFRAAALHENGHSKAIQVMQSLASIALDVVHDRSLLKRIKDEFSQPY